MTVEKSGSIDAIGIDRVTSEMVLTIIDHLAWDDIRGHLVLLQEKLNRYLGYLEAEEFRETYPQGIGKTARIDVVFLYPPPLQAESFFASATAVVSENGHTLTWRVTELSIDAE
jgi:hypothetical protein